MNKPCRLCSVISNPFYDGDIRICDTPFHQTPSFLTLPALGPLSLGHSMIVSKKHFASLLSMDSSFRSELQSECLLLSSAWSFGELTFAEHGSSCSDETGPCIAHTHVNVIPNVPQGMLTLERVGLNLIATGSLTSLPSIAEPYFLIGQNEHWSVYETGDTPSQFLRQILYTSMGAVHWDWRLCPNEELVALTLEKWQSLLKTP